MTGHSQVGRLWQLNANNSSTHGLWAATSPAAPDCPPLTTSEACDVAVVGAGYTGISAALFLAESGLTVRVLDAEGPGWGCSGRNGGQINPGLKLEFEKLAGHYGSTWVERVTRLVAGACNHVFYLIAKHEIECDAVRSGYVQGGIGRRGKRQLENRCEGWQRLGKDVQLLTSAQSAELLGTDAYDASMLHREGGSLQPLAYIRGLTRAAQAAGAVVHGQSRAISIEAQNREWRINTSAGSLVSRHVIIGTNGYTDGLWPGLRKAVVPVASVLTATEPLPGDVRRSILPGLHSVSETRHIQVYYRLDAQGRFIIGGAGPVWRRAEQGSTARCRRVARRYFPKLSEAKWTYDWAGYPAMTWDHAPKLMQLAPGVLAAMGYNGRGIAMATAVGTQMGRQIVEQEADLPIEAVYATPFHSLYRFGIALTLAKGRVLDAWDRLF